jgi:outer membrane protein OmpA-like peptidoglycan-associated protein
MSNQTHSDARKTAANDPVGSNRSLQRQCACGKHTTAGGECDECREKRLNLKRQATTRTEETGVPFIVHEVLSTLGRPLDTDTREAMEANFGQDLSQVRIHTDDKAADSAESVNAQAYTVGKDIVFGKGRHGDSSQVNQKLLAHELTHVVQQNSSPITGDLQIGKTNDLHEQAADQMAEQVVSKPNAAEHLPTAQQSAGVLQRQPETDSFPTQDLEPSPVGASIAGSSAIDGFELGKAELTEAHKKMLATKAAAIKRLLAQWPDSFISIVGHTDAVGTEEKNTTLGQERAEAVLAELKANGVPFLIMRPYSLGESALKIETKHAEPRNRRVEIEFNARRFDFKKMPLPKPTPDLTKLPGKTGGDPPPNASGKSPQPDWTGVPTTTPKKSDPIGDALNRDPLLRKVPDIFRGPLIDALKKGDETLIEKAIGTMKVDDKTKSALIAAAIALLRILKGEKWKPPTPPLHEPPPSNVPEMPKMPGEVIIKGPVIRF